MLCCEILCSTRPEVINTNINNRDFISYIINVNPFSTNEMYKFICSIYFDWAIHFVFLTVVYAWVA